MFRAIFFYFPSRIALSPSRIALPRPSFRVESDTKNVPPSRIGHKERPAESNRTLRPSPYTPSRLGFFWASCPIRIHPSYTLCIQLPSLRTPVAFFPKEYTPSRLGFFWASCPIRIHPSYTLCIQLPSLRPDTRPLVQWEGHFDRPNCARIILSSTTVLPSSLKCTHKS